MGSVAQIVRSRCLLRHRPYIELLPKADALLTPLYFTDGELDLFRGSNLYGAALDQKRTWDAEWQSLTAAIKIEAPLLAERFTW